MFDIAYPWVAGQGRCETTAVYSQSGAWAPVWPILVSWARSRDRDRAAGAFRLGPDRSFRLDGECRGGRLLIYRRFYLCHPESYAEFVAAGTRYVAIAAAAGAGSQGCEKGNIG